MPQHLFNFEALNAAFTEERSVNNGGAYFK